MSKQYVLDTNILLRGKREKGIVTYPVLCELDRLKTFSAEVGKDARDAIYNIYKNPEWYILDTEQKGQDESVDDYLVRFAKEHGYILKTLDLSLFLKSKALGVEALFDEYNYANEYTGTTYFNQLDDETVAKICSGEELDEKAFPTNHYIISNSAIYKVTNRRAHLIENVSFHSGYTGKIRPLNPEQRCAMHLLSDPDVTIVSISGGYGTGEQVRPFS